MGRHYDDASIAIYFVFLFKELFAPLIFYSNYFLTVVFRLDLLLALATPVLVFRVSCGSPVYRMQGWCSSFYSRCVLFLVFHI